MGLLGPVACPAAGGEMTSGMVLVGPRLIDFLPLLRADLSGTVAAVVADAAGVAPRPETSRPHTMRTYELAGRHRRLWTSLLTDQLDTLFATVLARHRDASVVVPYVISAAIERAVAAHAPAATLVGPSSELRTRIDDKSATRRDLAAAGVPTVDGELVNAPHVSFEELRRRFGPPVVIQPVRGSSGLGTAFVHDAAGFAEVRGRMPGPFLASRFEGTCVLNLHVYVGPTATIVSPPSVQLAGLPPADVPAPVYSGNDFGAAARLPVGLRADARAVAYRVGAWLTELGYRGIAGVDLVTDGRQCRLLEVNPRLQGSTWLLGEIERRAGVTPLLVRAVRDAHEPPGPGGVAAPTGAVAAPTGGAGAQLIVRASRSHSVDAGILARRPGAYGWRGDRLTFRRPVAGLADCDQDEVFVEGAPGPRMSHVDRFAVLARVASWDTLVEHDGRTLTDAGSTLVTWVLRRDNRVGSRDKLSGHGSRE
jgi:hypothetical protein